MWNYEHSSAPRFEQLLSSGPPPGKYWLALFMLIDDTCSVIASPDSPHRITIDNIEKIANSPSDKDLAELTAAEQAIIPGWVKLRALARKTLTSADVTDISASMSDLQTWLSALTESQTQFEQEGLIKALKTLSIGEQDKDKRLFPLQTDVQSLLLLAELLQATVRLCDAATRLAKNKTQKWWQAIPIKEVGALRAVAQDAFKDAVRQPALDWTNRLADKGVEAVAEAARMGKTGDMVVLVLGHSKSTWVRNIAGFLVQGPTEALDGVLKVKLA